MILLNKTSSGLSDTIILVLLCFALTSTGCDGGLFPGKKGGASLFRSDWSYSYDAVGAIRTPPESVGDSLVVASTEGRLTAFHTRNGSVKWRGEQFSPNSELISEGLVVEDEIIYGSHANQALAWDLSDGSTLWQFGTSGGDNHEFYDRGYYGAGPDHFYGSSGSLLAFSKQSGSVDHAWSFEFGPRGITYWKGAIYFTQAWTPEGAEGQSQGGIMKVEAKSGDSLWNYRTERGGFYYMRPLLSNDRVFAGTKGGKKTEFVALDAETGERLWRRTDVQVYAATLETVNGDAKIFVNDGRFLHALDADTGRREWRTNLEAGHGESQLAVLEGYVYHPHARSLFVVDATTGKIAHVEPPPDGSYFWEVGVGDGKVFAQTNHRLVAYEAYTPR